MSKYNRLEQKQTEKTRKIKIAFANKIEIDRLLDKPKEIEEKSKTDKTSYEKRKMGMNFIWRII